MQCLFIFTLALIPAALGAPTEKRATGDVSDELHRTLLYKPTNHTTQVELFTEENFAGQSDTIFVGDTSDWTGNCKKLPEPYALNLGSFKPSAGILCRLYRFVLSTYQVRHGIC